MARLMSRRITLLAPLFSLAAMLRTSVARFSGKRTEKVSSAFRMMMLGNASPPVREGSRARVAG